MWAITDADDGHSPIAAESRRANVGAMTEGGAQTVEQACELAARAGRFEACPGAECPLWENGGCSLERLLAEEDVPIDQDDACSGRLE
jgi:hypothetical protein